MTQRDNQDGAGKAGAGKDGAGKAGAGKAGAGKAQDDRTTADKVQEGLDAYNAVMGAATELFGTVAPLFTGGGE